MESLYFAKLESALIEEVVEIHMESLPNDFLPGLGRAFLRDNFYPAIVNSKYGEAYVAMQAGHACGFVIITKDSTYFFRSMIKNKFWGFLKIGLLNSFSSFNHFMNNLNIILSAFKEDIKPDYGEIYEIAVKNSVQGRGIGKKLVDRSIEYLENEKIQGIKIKTLKENVIWINSLKKWGWRIINEFKLIGKEYVVLCKEIGQTD